MRRLTVLMRLSHSSKIPQPIIVVVALIIGAPCVGHATTFEDTSASLLGSNGSHLIGAHGFQGNRLDTSTEFGFVLVGDPPSDLGFAPVESALQHAAKVWSSVGNSAATLTYDGRKDSVADVGPAEYAVLFVDPAEEPCFPDQPGLIGWTSYVCETLPGVSILLNARDYTWSEVPRPDDNLESIVVVDVRSVLTHEVGHVLGLTHSDEDRLATMVGSYLTDGGQSSLAADDKHNLGVIFPSGSSECSVDSDCGDASECLARDGVRVCEEERGSYGDFCAISFDICPTACLISSPETWTGYCTTSCDDECEGGSECNEEGFCQYSETSTEDTGCSASGSTTPMPMWVVLVLAIFGRRRSA